MKKAYLVAAILLFVATGCAISSPKQVTLKPEEAQKKAEKFINDSLDGKATATIENFTEDPATGMYKFTVNIPGNTQPIEAYLMKDGKTFFPQAVNIDEFDQQKAQNNNAQGSTDTGNPGAEQKQAAVKKSDKPVVEAFVMSHCPYGTQIEKGIIPVVEKLGKSIDFQIKFVNYAMHGEKELKEQLIQYCINKEEPAKFFPYLKCFLKSDESAKCLTEAKVNTGKVNACVTATDTKYKVMDNFKNNVDFVGQFPSFNIHKAENEKYGVQGSPTLVINGAQADSGRSPAELLKTICAGFNKAPAACSETLSSDQPAPGFGEGTQAATGGAAAGCGQ